MPNDWDAQLNHCVEHLRGGHDMQFQPAQSQLTTLAEQHLADVALFIHRIVLGVPDEPAGIPRRDARDLAIWLFKSFVRDGEDTGFVDTGFLVSAKDLLRIADGCPGG